MSTFKILENTTNPKDKNIDDSAFLPLVLDILEDII